MRKTLRFALLTVILVTLIAAAPAHAQTETERYPGAFAVEGSLDLVVALDGSVATADPTTSHLSRSQQIWIAGWAFECRSGLQPQTQRIGQFNVTFTRTRGSFGEMQQSIVSTPVVVARADVVAARQGDCPSVGPNVGFWALVTPPDDWGPWTMNLEISTTDGAGHIAWMPTQRKDVFIWP